MGKLRKTLALATLAGLVVPPIAAAVAKQRLVPIDDEAADEISLVTVFDGGRYASRSTAFRGGSVLCWYGGLDVDLREATLDPGGARLRVTSVFGGTRVIVPEGWQVRVRSTPVMGGVSDDTIGRTATGPTLEIEALAVFSGLRVTSHLDDEDALIAPPAGSASTEPGADDEAEREEILARAEADADAELVVEPPADEAVKAAASAEPPTEAVGPSGSNGS